MDSYEEFTTGTSLVVEWIRLHAPNAGSLSSITGEGTRFHIQQLKVVNAATKMQSSQIDNFLNKKFKKN